MKKVLLMTLLSVVANSLIAEDIAPEQSVAVPDEPKTGVTGTQAYEQALALVKQKLAHFIHAAEGEGLGVLSMLPAGWGRKMSQVLSGEKTSKNSVEVALKEYLAAIDEVLLKVVDSFTTPSLCQLSEHQIVNKVGGKQDYLFDKYVGRNPDAGDFCLAFECLIAKTDDRTKKMEYKALICASAKKMRARAEKALRAKLDSVARYKGALAIIAQESGESTTVIKRDVE